MTTSEKEIRVSVQVAIVAVVAMAGLIAFFSCANADGPENARNNTNSSEPKHEHAEVDADPAPSVDKLVKAVEKLVATANSGAVVGWAVALIAAINAWQSKQLFSLNREMGEVNARLGRIASDTESEKITRAKVNALLLKQLGVKGDEIVEALKEPEKK